MTEAARVMTAEELLRLPEDGYRTELVEGELIRMSPTGFRHGDIHACLVHRLREFVTKAGLGKVVCEVGFVLARSPDTVRAPDVAFIAQARLTSHGELRGFFPGAPDLAVEILSPDDRAGEIEEKIRQYFAAGTRLVWIVNPATRTVTVYSAAGTYRSLGVDATLDGGDVLPGFSVRVGDLFE